MHPVFSDDHTESMIVYRAVSSHPAPYTYYPGAPQNSGSTSESILGKYYFYSGVHYPVSIK